MSGAYSGQRTEILLHPDGRAARGVSKTRWPSRSRAETHAPLDDQEDDGKRGDELRRPLPAIGPDRLDRQGEQ